MSHSKPTKKPVAKFFRGIRQKFINQGKTANYLKYAIGEIVLVVIGILIALQINNWNDERKAAIVDKAQREEYIRNLYNEMQSNTADTESRIKGFQNAKEGAEYLLNSIERDCLKIGNTIRLMEAYRKMFDPIPIKQASAYDEMRISGKLNKIKDDTLLVELGDYYSQNNFIVELNQIYMSVLTDLVEFMMENSPLEEKHNFSDKKSYSFKFLKNQFHQEEFYKNVRKLYSMSRNNINANLQLKDSAQTVIDYMDKHYSDILKAQ